VARDDAVDHSRHTGGVRAAEAIVFEIDVVDDLAERTQRGVPAEVELREQRLERAAIALVREVAADHVERHLAGASRLRGRVDETNTRGGIDEPADQPAARDPIDLRAPARDPGAADEFPLASTSFRPAARFECSEHGGHLTSDHGAEKVRGRDPIELLLESPDGGIHLGIGRGTVPTRACSGQHGGGLSSERLERRVGLLAETGDERLCRDSGQERSPADVGRAAAGDRLARDPLQILEAVLARRQDVDGVLERERPDPQQAVADLRAEVDRCGRQLMDEHVPFARSVGRRASSHDLAEDLSVDRSVCQLRYF
jgi:hypothetical protein